MKTQQLERCPNGCNAEVEYSDGILNQLAVDYNKRTEPIHGTIAQCKECNFRWEAVGYTPKTALKVYQLIELLKKLPQNLEVYFEDLENTCEAVHFANVKTYGGRYKNNNPDFTKFDLVILKGQR